MTPQMTVLGLACEEAGTVADVQRRLTDLFAAAGFPKNAAHTNLPHLAAKGYVRLVDERAGVYEGTPAGLKRLREWIISAPLPPAVRETIHGKIEFVGTLEDLRELVIVVRAEAKAFRAASDEAHDHLLAEQNRRLSKPSKRWQEELSEELTAAHLADVKMMWEDMAERRRKLAERLELIYRRHSQRR